MNKRGLPFVIVVAVLLLVVGAGCAGDDDSSSGIQAEASATESVTPKSTAALTATDQPLPTQPTATATAVPLPTEPAAPTQPPAPTSDPACAKTTPNHLNIDKLRLQPGLTDAAIREVDSDSVGMVIDGVEVTVIGWGEVVRIHGDLTNEQQTRILRAVDAVRYAC